MWESLTKIVHIQIFNQLAKVGVEDVGEECVEHLRAGFPEEYLESKEIMLTQTQENTQQSELLFCSLHCLCLQLLQNYWKQKETMQWPIFFQVITWQSRSNSIEMSSSLYSLLFVNFTVCQYVGMSFNCKILTFYLFYKGGSVRIISLGLGCKLKT